MPLFLPPVEPNPAIDLAGKIVIITGGNAGLGFECARQFLMNKASTVILACRTVSKGEAARQRLLADHTVKETNARARIAVMRLDMESYDSVIEFADQVRKGYAALHILLLNTGIGQLNYEQAPTGHEKVTQVNYLSNALLALSLLPLLKATAAAESWPTRMSWVGSRNHERNSLHKKQPLLPNESVLEYFDDKMKYMTMAHYGDTKLLCVMFVAELAKRVDKSKVIINSMCPGMTKTEMVDKTPFYVRIPANMVMAVRARTAEQGARILLYAAMVAGEETHGSFLSDKDVAQ